MKSWADVTTILRHAEEPADLNPVPKAFRYLGWFWREPSSVYPECISFAQGHWWLDVARKWNYPSKRLTPADQDRLHDLCLRLPESNFEVNEFLDEVGRKIEVPA